MAIGEGRQIRIKFTQPLVGDVTGLNPPVGYSVVKLPNENISLTTLNALSVYVASKMLDGDTANLSFWRATTTINWIKAQLTEPKVLKKIRMYFNEIYCLLTFTLSGSQDGDNWEQIGGTFSNPSPNVEGWKEFDVDNNTEYKFYKIDTLTSKVNNDFLIYELELHVLTPVGNKDKFEVTFKEYSYVPYGTLQDAIAKIVSVERSTSYAKDFNLDEGNFNGVNFKGGKIILNSKE